MHIAEFRAIICKEEKGSGKMDSKFDIPDAIWDIWKRDLGDYILNILLSAPFPEPGRLELQMAEVLQKIVCAFETIEEDALCLEMISEILSSVGIRAERPFQD